MFVQKYKPVLKVDPWGSLSESDEEFGFSNNLDLYFLVK